MAKNFFKNIDISYDDAIKTQWYSIWSVGIPKKDNLHNWFLYYAEKNGDVLSASYVLHEYYEWKELEKNGCSPFNINSIALINMAERDGFKDVVEYVRYLNDIHAILLNQKVAQSASNDDYIKAHEIAFVKQMEYLREVAYEYGYLVTLGALALTVPFAKDRGTLVSKEQFREEINNRIMLEPTEDELIVVKQFWNRINDDLPYNINNKLLIKKVPYVVKPRIENIKDILIK